MKIGKYEFDSKQQFETKKASLGVAIDEDGNEYATHKHSLVELGHVVLIKGEYSENGTELTAPVLSSKYHIDAAWDLNDTYNDEGEIVKAKHPYGWASHSINIDSNGMHSFLGLDYLDYKI